MSQVNIKSDSEKCIHELRNLQYAIKLIQYLPLLFCSSCLVFQQNISLMKIRQLFHKMRQQDLLPKKAQERIVFNRGTGLNQCLTQKK